MERNHELILLDADMKKVLARMSKKFGNASFVQMGGQDTRNVQTTVQTCHEAPENE